MKCNQCGHDNKSSAKFCESCGAKLGASFCPECGHENQPGAQFCQECGATLGSKPAAASQPPRSAAPRSAGMSTGAIIALILAGVLVLGGGALLLFGDAIGIHLFGPKSTQESVAAPASNASRVTYSTNPAPVVPVGKPVELVYDWSAASRDLVQQFIDNAEQQVMVNGELVTAKVTFGEIVEDALTGGFKTAVATDVGFLPTGQSAVDTTISFRQPVSNGTETFGPGTQKEHVEKHGKVVVNDPADPQASSVDHSADNCPPPEDLTATELYWEGDTPAVGIVNKQGWEPYQEDIGNPAIFTVGSYPWGHPLCQVYPDDPTLLVCEGEYDQPATNRDDIGLYLPYPWSASKTGWCLFEAYPLEQAPVQCPTEDEVFPGEVYWENGVALIDIENPAGWEPYVEQPDFASFLAVNDERYTDLTCEVSTDDSTFMTCGGAGTIKTGGMGMFLNFPFNGSYCQLVYNEIGIKDICNEGYKFCVYAGACCPESYECDIHGCHPFCEGDECDG